MKTKHSIRFLLGLFLIILSNGCVTKALWNNPNLEAWNEPASNSGLRLFDAKPGHDVLVVYDEYSERSGLTHTRAYWLNENQKLVAHGHAPHFVSTNSLVSLIPVPVFLATTDQTNSLAIPYALVETNWQSFTLYSETGPKGPLDLPVYNDGKGKVEKFFITPAAVTADLTIVGAILGYCYLCSQGTDYNPAY